MEEGKNGRFHFHAILNNLEQVKGRGVSKHAEKFAFELVVKDCLRSEKIKPLNGYGISIALGSLSRSLIARLILPMKAMKPEAVSIVCVVTCCVQFPP